MNYTDVKPRYVDAADRDYGDDVTTFLKEPQHMRISSTNGYIAWHGSSSAFARWRTNLADVAQFPIFVPDDSASTAHPILDAYDITDANYLGDWDTTPADPLLVLLAHSDHTGHIRSVQAGPLADRLTGLLPLLTGEWCDTTSEFIAALRRAADVGDDLIFE